MKFPQSFRPVKSLDGKIEDLLSPKPLVYNLGVVDALLYASGEFLKNECDSYEKDYDMGVGLVKGLKYNLKDVEELSKRIKVETEEYRNFGVYLSVLINEKITEKDVVTLVLEEKLNCIGMYLQRGTLIIEGDVYDGTGFCMEGGKLIVEGNANDNTGYGMVGGELVVKGNANDNIGRGMKGGKLVVEGNTNDYTGLRMIGGEILVKGNANDYTGLRMIGGEILVKGNANDYTGRYMKGGKLIVKGKINNISNEFRNGVIVEGGKVRRDC